MVFEKKEQFKTGEGKKEEDPELKKRLDEQKKRVKAFFEKNEPEKKGKAYFEQIKGDEKLADLFEKIKNLSDEEWEKLGKKRLEHQDLKPH